MTKLTEKQIKRLEEAKKDGVKTVFKYCRKYYSTWYVELFSVDELLEKKTLPSYWYRNKGMTETKALKDGAIRLLSW